ncbi:hypothetical protein AQUCO_02800075v1 [Aquilegia coerulea]|uniref:Cytochrome P450 n=1 Tax=Aquilegia coerulea TaxID=218851 RepID=A0A2G5D3T3_AQUCA|nr:hypothetical protein AQUCO_02800075v1 [Aquilegia coerulea]
MELQPAYFSFVFILILILFLFMLLKVNRSAKPRTTNSKLPPQPWKLPIIGHLHHLLGLPHHILRNLAQKYGPLMLLQLGEVHAIIVSSPKVAREILKTHDIEFADRPALLAGKIMSYDFVGVLFSPYGQYWRQLRKICSQELLSTKKVQSLWSIREEEVSNLIEKISSEAGFPVNISQKLNSLANDIISRAAFGKKCKDKDAFISLMLAVLRLGGGFEFVDFFPSLKFLHGISGTKIKLQNMHQKIDKILEDIIDDHRENRVRIESKEGEYEEDLVDVLLRIQNDSDLATPLENNNIKAVLLDIFFGGSDTAAITMAWALSELMRNPRVMVKAQTEVRHVFNGKRKVEQSDINELDYLRLVIKETLRLHPPTPLLPPRENREKCEIEGYEIPRKTKVIVNIWAIGRDPKFWSNAEEFIPERFEDHSIDFRGANFEYIPFGAGKRICPGMSFGLANVEHGLAQLLYHFDWDLPDGVKPAELDMTEVFGATVNRRVNLKLIPTLYRPLAVVT